MTYCWEWISFHSYSPILSKLSYSSIFLRQRATLHSSESSITYFVVNLSQGFHASITSSEVHSPLPFSAHFASTSCWASIASFSHQSITFIRPWLSHSRWAQQHYSHLRRFHVRFSIWRAWLVQQPTILFEIRCYPAQVPYSYALQAIQSCAPSK